MNSKKSLITSSIIGFLLLPVVAFAQYENWVSRMMGNILTPVWQLFAGIAAAMFVVAGILFTTSNGEPGKITTAKNAAIWGIVGIVVASLAFVMVQIVSSWV